MVVSVPTTDYPRIIARRKSAFCKRERKRERERGEREKKKKREERERKEILDEASNKTQQYNYILV
jgi:hypothetical protein